jgi:hypothetical protein
MTLSSWSLQQLIVTRLKAHVGLTALITGRVYDQPPKDVAAPYISIGPSDVVEDDADCILAAVETLQLDVWSEAQDGKREAKLICDQVRAALHGYSAEPAVGALAGMRVALVRVFDDPDGRTTHGVVQVECLIEEGEV